MHWKTNSKHFCWFLFCHRYFAILEKNCLDPLPASPVFLFSIKWNEINPWSPLLHQNCSSYSMLLSGFPVVESTIQPILVLPSTLMGIWPSTSFSYLLIYLFIFTLHSVLHTVLYVAVTTAGSSLLLLKCLILGYFLHISPLPCRNCQVWK